MSSIPSSISSTPSCQMEASHSDSELDAKELQDLNNELQERALWSGFGDLDSDSASTLTHLEQGFTPLKAVQKLKAKKETTEPSTQESSSLISKIFACCVCSAPPETSS